jgi:hypothetical protein
MAQFSHNALLDMSYLAKQMVWCAKKPMPCVKYPRNSAPPFFYQKVDPLSCQNHPSKKGGCCTPPPRGGVGGHMYQADTHSPSPAITNLPDGSTFFNLSRCLVQFINIQLPNPLATPVHQIPLATFLLLVGPPSSIHHMSVVILGSACLIH